jgi:hypothetical protein
MDATSSNAFSPANTLISVWDKASFTFWYFLSSVITTMLGLNFSAC